MKLLKFDKIGGSTALDIAEKFMERAPKITQAIIIYYDEEDDSLKRLVTGSTLQVSEAVWMLEAVKIDILGEGSRID